MGRGRDICSDSACSDLLATRSLIPDFQGLDLPVHDFYAFCCNFSNPPFYLLLPADSGTTAWCKKFTFIFSKYGASQICDQQPRINGHVSREVRGRPGITITISKRNIAQHSFLHSRTVFFVKSCMSHWFFTNLSPSGYTSSDSTWLPKLALEWPKLPPLEGILGLVRPNSESSHSKHGNSYLSQWLFPTYALLFATNAHVLAIQILRTFTSRASGSTSEAPSTSLDLAFTQRLRLRLRFPTLSSPFECALFRYTSWA